MSAVDRAAREYGYDHGENAARWAAQDAFGGRVSKPSDARASARAWLKKIEQGSDQFYDLMGDPLSGEWADSMTPASLAEYLEEEIAEELGLEPDEFDAREAYQTNEPEDFDSILADACNEYEEGFRDGFEETFRELAESAAEDDDE